MGTEEMTATGWISSCLPFHRLGDDMNEAGFIPEFETVAETETTAETVQPERENKASHKETELETETETGNGAVKDNVETETQEDLLEYIRSIDSNLAEMRGTLEAVQGTIVNVEYDAAMQFVILSVGVGLLALLAGFFFARVIFRKL